MLLAVTLRSELAALMPDSEVLKLMADSCVKSCVACAEGSADAEHVVERDRAQSGQVEVEAVAADGDAVDRAADVGVEVAFGAVAGDLAGRDAVAAGRQAVAHAVAAVPVEGDFAGLVGGDGELADLAAVGVGDGEGHV